MPSESSVLVRLRLLGAQAFSRDARRASQNLGKLDGTAQRVSGKLQGVHGALGGAAAAMRGVGVGAGVVAAGGLLQGVKASAGFEQSMANVQARLLTSRDNMLRLQEQALDLGAKTQFSARQAADAMGEFAAAGFSTNQIMGMLPGTMDLAAASGSDLATSAETMGAMLRQFGLGAKDGGHVADLLTRAVNKSAINMDDLAYTMKYVGPVAGRFNQNIEDVAASAAILGNVGIKGETAGTTLRRAFVNIVRPSQRTMNVLSDLGISAEEFGKATTDAQGKLRPFPQMIGNLSGEFQGLTKPDKRKAIAQLFGVEALPGMLTLMGKGEDKINKMSGVLEKSGGAAKKTAGIMRNTVSGAFERFTGSLETASIRMMSRFNPAIRGALGAASGAIDKASAGGGPLQGVFAWIGRTAPKIVAIVKDVGGQLIDAFKPAAPFFSNVLLPLLKGVGQGVAINVVFAFKAAIAVIKVIANVLGWLGQKAAPLKGVFEGIGTVIGFLLGGPILKGLQLIPKLGIVFKLLGVPLKVATGAVRFLGRVVAKGAGFMLRMHMAVIRFGATLPAVFRKVVLSAGNFVGGVLGRIEGLIGSIRGLGGRFLNAGKGIVRSVWKGIASAFGSGAGFVMDIGRSFADWLNRSTPLGDKVNLPSPLPDFRLPALASGGHIRRGGAALVGERGPELVKLPTNSTVYDSKQTQRARASMSGGVPIFVTANLHLSGKQIHSEVFRIDRAMAESS